MDRLQLERTGGPGFGLPGSHLKSKGEVSVTGLSAADRQAVEDLFASKKTGAAAAPGKPDEFRYHITRQTASGPVTIDVPESVVPMALRNSVKDVLE